MIRLGAYLLITFYECQINFDFLYYSYLSLVRAEVPPLKFTETNKSSNRIEEPKHDGFDHYIKGM